MRRYDDPVEVRRGPVAGWEDEGPQQFLWRGRLWKVRAVLEHRVVAGPWRHSPEEAAATGSVRTAGRSGLLAERELWRVEAGQGREAPAAGGVFDLALDRADGRWQLVGCAD